jgi:hypothetical protein
VNDAPFPVKQHLFVVLLEATCGSRPWSSVLVKNSISPANMVLESTMIW